MRASSSSPTPEVPTSRLIRATKCRQTVFSEVAAVKARIVGNLARGEVRGREGEQHVACLEFGLRHDQSIQLALKLIDQHRDLRRRMQAVSELPDASSRQRGQDREFLLR